MDWKGIGGQSSSTQICCESHGVESMEERRPNYWTEEMIAKRNL